MKEEETNKCKRCGKIDTHGLIQGLCDECHPVRKMFKELGILD